MTSLTPPPAVAHHERIAAAFETNYTQRRSMDDRLSFWATELAGRGPVGLSVDLGCGPGLLTELLSPISQKVIAVDGSENMLRLCRERTRSAHHYVEADLNRSDLAFMAGADLIILSSVVEYLNDPADLMARIARVCAPGATILASIPNRASWYRRFETACHAVTRRPRYLPYSVSRPRPDELEVGGLAVARSIPFAVPPVPFRYLTPLMGQQRAATFLLVELRPLPSHGP